MATKLLASGAGSAAERTSTGVRVLVQPNGGSMEATETLSVSVSFRPDGNYAEQTASEKTTS